MPTPLFLRGLSPVETDLGDSCNPQRRMERSTVFQEWKLSLWPFVKVSGSDIACLDFRSKPILQLPSVKRDSLRTFFSEAAGRVAPFARLGRLAHLHSRNENETVAVP